jgi:hypothetical protein
MEDLIVVFYVQYVLHPLLVLLFYVYGVILCRPQCDCCVTNISVEAPCTDVKLEEMDL